MSARGRADTLRLPRASRRPATVSRRHAEFTRRGTAFEVRDLGSLNGTYYDGVRIERALLSDSAEVQIGKFRLTFYASRQDLAASANGAWPGKRRGRRPPRAPC